MNEENGFTLLEILLSLAITGMILGIIGGGLRIGIAAWHKGESAIQTYQKARNVLKQITEEIKSAYPYIAKIDGNKVYAFRGEPNRICFITSLGGLTSGRESSGLREVHYYIKSDRDRDRDRDRMRQGWRRGFQPRITHVAYGDGDRDRDKKTGLFLKEDIIPNGELFGEKKNSREVMIDPDMIEVKFRYKKIASEGENTNEEWFDSWDPLIVPSFLENQEKKKKLENRIPAAVEMKIIIRTENKREMPLQPLVIPIWCEMNLGNEVVQ